MGDLHVPRTTLSPDMGLHVLREWGGASFLGSMLGSIRDPSFLGHTQQYRGSPSSVGWGCHLAGLGPILSGSKGTGVSINVWGCQNQLL